MRALKYASEYEVIFSLMNNNPEHMKMDWEIREALDGYLRPFLKEASVVSNLTINSQVIGSIDQRMNKSTKQNESDTKLCTTFIKTKI